MTSGLTDRQREAGRRFLDRMMIWSAVLLVLAVAAFAAYYYLDQRSGGSASPLEREIVRYEQAVHDDPQDISARMGLAELYYGDERYSESAQQYEAALTIDDQSTLAKVGLGRALLGMGDQTAALDNFQQVIDLTAEADIAGDLVETAHYYMADVLLDQQQTEDAIAHLEKAVAIKRSDADAWNLLGAAYIESGNPDKAIVALTEAVRFVPDFEEAYEKLVLAYEQKGLAPESQYARGMLAYSQGRYVEAEDELTAAVDAKPTLVDAHVGLGLVHELQSQLELAISSYKQALHVDPDNFSARAGLARLGASTQEGSAEEAVTP